MKLRVQVSDKSADGRPFDESKGLKEDFSRLKEKVENTYQIACCNDREHMLLYASLCHRDRGGWFFCRLGEERDGLLCELRCPTCFVMQKQEKRGYLLTD